MCLQDKFHYIARYHSRYIKSDWQSVLLPVRFLISSCHIDRAKRVEISLKRVTARGETPIGLNQSNSYSIGGLQGFSNVDLEWEVRYMDAPSPTPFNLIISPDERTAFLKCEDYGLFKTIVRGYRNGKFMAFGQLDIIVLP